MRKHIKVLFNVNIGGNNKKHTQLMFYYVILPATLTVLLNAALPKTTLGCANRGLVAFTIAIISVLAAFFTIIMASKKRISNKSESDWWIISTLILIIPVIALLILA